MDTTDGRSTGRAVACLFVLGALLACLGVAAMIGWHGPGVVVGAGMLAVGQTMVVAAIAVVGIRVVMQDQDGTAAAHIS